jgi:acyl-CoA synthetase (NDP forming)
VLAADEIDAAGLEVPPLPEDVMSISSAENFVTTMRPAAQPDSIDVVLFHTSFAWGGRVGAGDRVQETVANLVKAREAATKPIIVSIKPSLDADAAQHAVAFTEACVREGIALFPGIDRAARALAGLARWRAMHADEE